MNEALAFALGFPCVMGSRILINLREVALKEDRYRHPVSVNLSVLEFASWTSVPPPLYQQAFSRKDETSSQTVLGNGVS